MNLTSLVDKIARRHKEREQHRINDYRSLVQAIATGHEPDEDQVDRVRQDAGKSLDDLRGAVDLHRSGWPCRSRATACRSGGR